MCLFTALSTTLQLTLLLGPDPNIRLLIWAQRLGLAVHLAAYTKEAISTWLSGLYLRDLGRTAGAHG